MVPRRENIQLIKSLENKPSPNKYNINLSQTKETH